MEPLLIAAFLAIVAKRLVDGLITPLFDRYDWDKFALKYIAWAVAGALVWASGVNLFEAYLPGVLLGQIMTAIVGGGGANFLHDLFNPKYEPLPFE